MSKKRLYLVIDIMSAPSGQNNGMITKIWGGPGWIFNHTVTFGYPINPTVQDRESYRSHFTTLGDVLPCSYCRESYKKFIVSGDTMLTDDDLKDRESLTKWFYRIHNRVNEKLGIKYFTSYEDISKKYESFRARCIHSATTVKTKQQPVPSGCLVPLDYKAYSFRNANYKDGPVISLQTAERFIDLAKRKDVEEIYFTFFEIAKHCSGDFDAIIRIGIWQQRNHLCTRIIEHMRENAIDSLDIDGTPSVCELQLILLLSSNLPSHELDVIKLSL